MSARRFALFALASSALAFGLIGDAPHHAEGQHARGRCGDARVRAPEACDDGNVASYDGCSSTCAIERPEDSVFHAANPLRRHLTTVDQTGPNVPNEEGSFRIKCGISHFNYDDPIVHPARPGHAHLHMYLGNTDADADTTEDNIGSSAGSTCQGGPLNRTAYWVPTLLRPVYRRDRRGRIVRGARGAPVKTGEYAIIYPIDLWVLDENGVPVRDESGAAVYNGNNGTDIYYKRAAAPGDVQPLPVGLRMIAGDATRTPGDPPNGAVRFRCKGQSEGGAPHIERCRPARRGQEPNHLLFEVFFPQCWDGVHLDSPDHKSHMAFPIFPEPPGTPARCPESHPVWIPHVSYQIFYPVTRETVGPRGDTSDWFLASDSYEVGPDAPGGASAHGDWYMAWNPEVVARWTRLCINERRHCANGDIGNGFALSSVAPGRGNAPPISIIEHGLGAHAHASH